MAKVAMALVQMMKDPVQRRLQFVWQAGLDRKIGGLAALCSPAQMHRTPAAPDLREHFGRAWPQTLCQGILSCGAWVAVSASRRKHRSRAPSNKGPHSATHPRSLVEWPIAYR